MSNLSEIFQGDAKVVISPDEMRAWIMLPPPPKGVTYTAEAVTQWLPQHGVVYGADQERIKEAIASKRFYELLEVARGDAPQDEEGGSYVLRVEKRPFTGLRANSDGSLMYDDLSFLQEVPAGAHLADVVPPKPGVPGRTVTGQEVAPRPAPDTAQLKGSGFELSADGQHYIAPTVSHVSIVNNELVVTPLLRLETVDAEHPVDFEGNVYVEKDVHSGSVIKAAGSVFIAGRTLTAEIRAGRNVLLGGGMRASDGFGEIEAKDNVWGLVFESANITAGGDLAANHITGCEAKVGGRCTVLGGRAAISNTTLYAKGGVVAGILGSERGDNTVVSVGMDSELIETYEGLERRLDQLTADVQAQQQSITAFERINRGKPDRGKSDPAYQDMVTKRNKMLEVYNILTEERTKLRRTMNQASVVSIIVRVTVFPGVTVNIDTRTYEVNRRLDRMRFRRDGEIIELISASER